MVSAVTPPAGHRSSAHPPSPPEGGTAHSRRPPEGGPQQLAKGSVQGQWRVTQRSAYARIQSRGARVHTPHFVIVVLHRSSDGAAGALPTRRLGITVTKKVARRAVDRNRVKRLVREVFRRQLDCFPEGCDVVFLAKPKAWELGYAEVASEVERARRALGAASHKSRTRGEAVR